MIRIYQQLRSGCESQYGDSKAAEAGTGAAAAGFDPEGRFKPARQALQMELAGPPEQMLWRSTRHS